MIRVVAVCVFRHATRILVGSGVDDQTGKRFFRPLGGSVEFGERAAAAVRREIREELRAEITTPVQLGVLETIFTHNGRPGHEYVIVFDARFVDEALYERDALPLFEECWGGETRWLDLSQPIAVPLYPEGLLDLLMEGERKQ